LKGLPIRAFVAAFFLCELRVAFAFFAFTILFENAKVAKRNPAKTAKVCISNFKFKSEILDRLPIRAFVAAFFLCELRVAFAFFAFSFRKRKVRQAKPRKGREGLHLEFQIQI